MNKFFNKVTSFFLLFLLLVLSLNKLKVIDYSQDLRNIFYFLTLVLTIFTSINVILTNNSKLSKFINIVIILNLIIGGIISILETGLNIYIYICLIFTSIYCIVDMFYKKA